MREKITQMLGRSREVIECCSLQNGAIVASNSDLEVYPESVQSYRYVWPRDASFILVAADILKIKSIHSRFFTWLLRRAEGFNETGILFQNYHANGPKRWVSFQPDQNGSMLWSIYEHSKRNILSAEALDIVQKLADGICSQWGKTHFLSVSQDLWEERYAFPADNSCHTYSLAACSSGLKCAFELLGNEKWLKVSGEMRDIIACSYNGSFPRLSGLLSDYSPDASLLGLVYPFGIYGAADNSITDTVRLIEERIVRNGCVYRYENDSYDSFRNSGIDARRNAGFWPLLNFWMSIYYSMKNNRRKSLDYYLTALECVDDYFPEQVFGNKIQKSPKPLAWAHAMFVLSSEKLGFVKDG